MYSCLENMFDEDEERGLSVDRGGAGSVSGGSGGVRSPAVAAKAKEATGDNSNDVDGGGGTAATSAEKVCCCVGLLVLGLTGPLFWPCTAVSREEFCNLVHATFLPHKLNSSE